MSTVQMRPTFLLETNLSSEESMERIRAIVTPHSDHTPHSDRVAPHASDGHSSHDQGQNYRGQFTRNHAVISIDDSKRHFWSPWMHLEIRNTDAVRQISGRFSPHPSIWTGFIFSYLAIGVLVFFAMMFGVSQQLSSQSPWAYYLIPVGGLVAAILWFASKAGQKLAHDEMVQMKTELEESIRRKTLSTKHPVTSNVT